MRLKGTALVTALLLGATLATAGSATAASGKKSAARDAYVKPVIGGIYGKGVHGPGSYAILIDVSAIHKGKSAAAAANCSNDGPASGTFALTGWKIGGNRTAHLNPATVPGYLGGVRTALQRSWNAWRVEAAVPAVTVATNGTVTRYTANRSYDLLWGRTSGSIATTYTWRWNDGFVESDTVFNKNLSWFKAASEGDGCREGAGSRYDVANIATHELGHSYGLDHSPGRYETMYAFGYTGETLKRSPARGDRTGIRTIY